MIEVEWKDENLKRVLAKGGRAADKVAKACVKRSHTWAEKIAREAQKMVPVQIGILLESQEVRKHARGFIISYGGKASAYAHYQHEGTNLQHHPPSNKYTYEGGIYTDTAGAGGGPGDWNEPRALVFGKYAGVNRWRYKEKQYGRRSLRASHGQSPGATHHWLYGASHSAYDSNRERMWTDLTNVGVNVILELLDAS